MKKSILKKILGEEKGSVAIEFSFVMPIVLLITFAMFEFCRILFTIGILNYSAEQGTRYAMVNFDHDNIDADYITAIKDDIERISRDSFILVDDDYISSFDVEVITNADNTSMVNIIIDYTYHMSMPIIPNSDFNLSGSSESFLVQ